MGWRLSFSGDLEGREPLCEPAFIPGQMDTAFARLKKPEFLPGSDAGAFVAEAASFSAT